MHQSAEVAGHSALLGGKDLTDLVAQYARVSNPTALSSGRAPHKLVDYLIRHHHWSPFEMVNVCLDVRTSRDIARQFLRHRSFSFQEFSQRYSATETSGGSRECRTQDHTNRQSSNSTDDVQLNQWWGETQKEVTSLAFKKYDEALKRGVAKEQARVLLPEGLTYSRLFVNGSLRSWIHYVQLRTGVETQKEHRELARMCGRAISAGLFPQMEEFIQEEPKKPKEAPTGLADDTTQKGQMDLEEYIKNHKYNHNLY